MPGRNEQRKLGTTRGSPRRFRTAKASRIEIDEGKTQEHLGEVVRSMVEETLNAMLDAEADRVCRAEHYERPRPGKTRRRVPISGNCTTQVGEVTLKVPKLRTCRSRLP